jgi:uncharacterized protein with PIN domain
MLNVPQTIVALLTTASHHEEVSEDMAEEVSMLVGGASRLELVMLLCALSNINNYALDMLEQHTPQTKAGFLRALGYTVSTEES